jgi:restriction system protein
MRSRSDGTIELILFIIGIGYVIYEVFQFKGLIIAISILLLIFLFMLIPEKCKHGKRGKCVECKKEEDVRQKELSLKYQYEREQREFKHRIQLKIIENQNHILSQLTIFNSQSIESMTNLSPYEFEHTVAKIYQDLGYKVKVTSQSNDKGKDIIMYKDGKKYLVECKKYNSENLVTRPELQKFMAAIYEEKAVKGFFVTTSDYTSTAYEYPKDVNYKLELLSGKDLMNLVYKAYPNRTKYMNYNMICQECGDTLEFIYPGKLESVCKKRHRVVSNIEELIISNSSPRKKINSNENSCPKCNSQMTKKWSRINRQYFWGCTNYPICNGTLPTKSRG